ncbi:hypothetical protein HanRHA438_Chr05g0242701 [Helianthus annuus]|nr:hypothetical protein HanRHA438_Chr05g0242701 [Helianthus annuus]
MFKFCRFEKVRVRELQPQPLHMAENLRPTMNDGITTTTFASPSPLALHFRCVR